MSAHVRTSACVDCEVPIIGDSLRCAACQANRAAIRPLGAVDRSPGRVVLVWMGVVAIEVVALVVCAVLLVMKGCR